MLITKVTLSFNSSDVKAVREINRKGSRARIQRVHQQRQSRQPGCVAWLFEWRNTFTGALKAVRRWVSRTSNRCTLLINPDQPPRIEERIFKTMQVWKHMVHTNTQVLLCLLSLRQSFKKNYILKIHISKPHELKANFCFLNTKVTFLAEYGTPYIHARTQGRWGEIAELWAGLDNIMCSRSSWNIIRFSSKTTKSGRVAYAFNLHTLETEAGLWVWG